MNILLIKESNAGEQRVALIPEDAKKLMAQGCKLFIEEDAGLAAGFSNSTYEAIGAQICDSPSSTAGFSTLFNDKDIILRAKRPNHSRERQEAPAYQAGTILIGALDPLEKNSPHIQEYQQAGITSYSIDQLDLTADDPMNILAQMSHIAGTLGLIDAISKYQGDINKVVIIGFGTVGQAAFAEAIRQGYTTEVMVRSQEKADAITQQGGIGIALEKGSLLEEQQAVIKSHLLDASIVITSARAPGKPAPLLIPTDTLNHMPAGSVIIDMSIAEGGNVEGSQHDSSLSLGNAVLVSNTSGYPKVKPHEASILWSRASRLLIELLLKGEKPALESLS